MTDSVASNVNPAASLADKSGRETKQVGFNTRKRKEVTADAVIKMRCSFNNTIISVIKGTVTLAVRSAGFEFKNAKKGTAHAARHALDRVMDKAIDVFKSRFKRALRWVEIEIKGPSQGWDQAVLLLKNKGVEVVGMRDVTGIPHNGCRRRKRRRV
jgi:small subunit ribosomal protein S11